MKKLDSMDRFIFIASDGVWDYLSPKEVIERVNPFMPTLNAECAVKKVINEAADRWKKVNIFNFRKDSETILLYCSLL